MPPESDLLFPFCSNNTELINKTTSEFSKNGSDSEAPDLPPDSFWVPKEDELDWLNKNAFIQRNGSTKITSSGLNPTPNHSLIRSSYTSSSSRSQKLSFNSKTNPSIIGLPKSQKSCLADGKLRRPGSSRLFRSRSEPGGKPVGRDDEPGSPMVSCMGRVRSGKGKVKKTALWARLRAIFRTGLAPKRVVISKGNAESIEPESGPDDLGFKRLESRKRSELWSGDDVDEKGTVRVEKS